MLSGVEALLGGGPGTALDCTSSSRVAFMYFASNAKSLPAHRAAATAVHTASSQSTPALGSTFRNLHAQATVRTSPFYHCMQSLQGAALADSRLLFLMLTEAPCTGFSEVKLCFQTASTQHVPCEPDMDKTQDDEALGVEALLSMSCLSSKFLDS